MGEMNKKRAQWAEDAMRAVPAFAEMMEPEEGGPYTAVKDLLCDLMHYCYQNNTEFDDVFSGALLLFEGELADDE